MERTGGMAENELNGNRGGMKRPKERYVITHKQDCHTTAGMWLCGSLACEIAWVTQNFTP